MNDEKEIWERLTATEQRLKSIGHRLDNLEALTESVYTIATELKATREDVTEVKSRLIDVENRPTKRYETIVTSIITLILGSVAGIVFSKIGLR